VEIAEALLAAGAEVDAAAHVYGGGCTALGLAATGIHPERAGVQNALLDKLLEHGAVLEQPSIGGNRLPLLMACLSNGRLKAAEHLAGRGARLNLPVAAALGRLDLTRSFFQAGGGTPGPTAEEMTVGFLFACAGGRNRVIEFLLERGVPLTAQDSSGQTGLHWAAIGGHLDTVKLLLHRGAPLEVMNSYGGTVLGQALWSVANDGEKPDSIGILEALVDAGASLPNPCPPVNPRVDAWLSQHGRIT
jgi:ankyrin repeat protein